MEPEKLDALSALKQATGLSRSELIRRCVYRELSQVIRREDVLSGWRADEILSTWEEAKMGLQRPKLQCYDVLKRRFDDELGNTRRKIEADPGGFERFADEYIREYHGAECYDQLLKSGSGQAFSNVENLIAEYTEYSIPKMEEDGFLQDLLQEED